jgi:hypothetical protein
MVSPSRAGNGITAIEDIALNAGSCKTLSAWSHHVPVIFGNLQPKKWGIDRNRND